ncbi:ShlB/FhaC/HecB family hemolysin secretion/activation protein [Ferruginibacter sp. SUN106]|uniref:ShlB/FhaC/HecB family hemolysin secretion/activation protein n=1 Tax=Ferruginibacter sp. SUN106 TaxID=2978348 RepID=UPI003D35EC46
MNKGKSTSLVFFLLAVIVCKGLFLQTVYAQPPLINSKPSTGNNPKFQLKIHLVDKDTTFNLQALQLQTVFDDALQCRTYISTLTTVLHSKGYPTASVDSVWEDSTAAGIRLFLGQQYHWIKLLPDSIEKKAIDESGYYEKNFSNKLLNMQQLQTVQLRILNYYEKNGYPFAQVFLDSIRLQEDKINALLKVNKGPLYRIDSIRVFGKAKISKNFLNHYLSIPKASLYNKEKLEQVSKKILELPYLQEAQANDITMLGTGSVLNLYLQPKKSSQFNFLIGVLPAANQASKFQLTADVNLNLKNALSGGESILFNWQQLQKKSPRLNLGYQQPYIFNSNFGFDFLFDLFKKDSTFLQVNGQVGLQYLLSANQSGKFFVQWQNSFLLANGVDTNLVKLTKQLPVNIDVSAASFGLDYDWIKTDYRLNPRSGNEVKITTSVGIKNIKRNNDILGIKDPSFNYASLYDSLKERSYQFRIKAMIAHYFPIGKQSTLKAALNTAIYNSQSIFRNELFQIGGYRLLRGFDEESIYATQYAVATAEYRIRVSLNSYFFVFTDGGMVKNKYQNINLNNTFISTGLGMALETKLGLLNISYAIGKRDDIKFNIREASKIHFGYVNYF